MGIEFDVVTTKTGDSGQTSDYAGKRDWKNSPLFNLLGDLDELGSWLGVLKHLGKNKKELSSCQGVLLGIGALVATNPQLDNQGKVTEPLYATLHPITSDNVEALEVWEKSLMIKVKIKEGFVLTGGTKKAAWCDIARTVCRRAERSMVNYIRFSERQDLEMPERWINRLSDVLYILARTYAYRR